MYWSWLESKSISCFERNPLGLESKSTSCFERKFPLGLQLKGLTQSADHFADQPTRTPKVRTELVCSSGSCLDAYAKGPIALEG